MRARTHALERSIARGVDLILSHQSVNGSWTDWDLPPGSSSIWTTGYVGYRLCSLPQHLKTSAAPHILAAANWLLANASADGGWGYNAIVGSDADSTSFAILFLASAGRRAPEWAYTHLTSYQRPDGGFATYLPGDGFGSWTTSHPDVTPVALLALLTRGVPDRRALYAGIDYVLMQQTPEALWRSFWWNSFLYGTEASLSLLHTAGVEGAAPANLSRFPPTNAFETALLISSLLYLDPSGLHDVVLDLADRLVAQQHPDGGWEAAPILRITRRDCFEPWESDAPGPLFSDPRRLFTTSTVLHALSRTVVSLDSN
jgi:squalene-hopene/tetraprenyl-beta-curcumene cyclase